MGDLQDYVPPLALCARCGARQRWARMGGRRWAAAGLLTPTMVVGLAAMLAPQVVGAWGLFLVAIVAGVFAAHVARTLARRRAQEATVLILGGQGDAVTLQLRVPEAQAPISETHPYREASPPRHGDEPTSQALPASRLRWLPRAAIVLGLGTAALVREAAFPLVLLDGGPHPCRVRVDGGPWQDLSAGEHLTMHLAHGRHTVQVARDDAEDTWPVALPWGEPHLLALGGPSCYEQEQVLRGGPRREFVRVRRQRLIGTWIALGHGGDEPDLDEQHGNLRPIPCARTFAGDASPALVPAGPRTERVDAPQRRP